jgi:hypothetical protein
LLSTPLRAADEHLFLPDQPRPDLMSFVQFIGDENFPFVWNGAGLWRRLSSGEP